ncbi:MAG: FAD-dependent oxidoreductase [Clostridia bacterium]|nr:FAD-dependent oxidoreductase [Clostridia bacterium]
MNKYVHEIPAPSENPPIEKAFDVVVIGGGMSGLLAAIASARQGAKTVLVQDRSVLGGNASSETRMHISGASCHWGKRNAAETGILMELQLENKRLNDSYNYSIWDGVLWHAAKKCDNLELYLNTSMQRVFSDGKRISGVICYQLNTEKRFVFTGNIYIDATGNGTLGYFAGAEYRIGREAADEFGEKDAPDVRDGETMGNTIYFTAHDTGHPVKFIKPEWAYDFDESDFKHRYHGDIVVYHDAEDVVVLRPDEDYADHADQLVEKYDVQSGYWWNELGGDWDDIISQAEDIRWELYRCAYGIWDHIKNGGDHGAENYELDWVANMAGTRESRRIMGDYVLTEQDILSNNERKDGVAYGGWPMDEHTAGGLRAKGQIPSRVRSFDGLYAIPYGCFCSNRIENMMMAGRNISATKLAMGSTRVMGTCAVGGEAAGTAAGMAVKAGLTPRALGEAHIEKLRQELLKNDCYIPGCRNEDENDLARQAEVFASSEKPGYEAINILSGVTRSVADKSNMWMSDGFSQGGEIVRLCWKKPVTLSQIRLTFDPNLSEERCISVSKAFIDKEPKGVAAELVKDYTLRALLGGNVCWEEAFTGNYQRLRIHDLPRGVTANEVQLVITATNGDACARVFEIRCY